VFKSLPWKLLLDSGPNPYNLSSTFVHFFPDPATLCTALMAFTLSTTTPFADMDLDKATGMSSSRTQSTFYNLNNEVSPIFRQETFLGGACPQYDATEIELENWRTSLVYTPVNISGLISSRILPAPQLTTLFIEVCRPYLVKQYCAPSVPKS
jgi:hypothetical protein